MMKKLLLLLFLSFQIQVFAQTANPAFLKICDDDNDGYALFDLTAEDVVILNGQAPSDFIVTYYETLPDAQNGTNALMPNYINTSSYFQTIYARVEELSTGDFATAPVGLTVDNTPIANLTPDLIYCDTGGGIANFDLTLNSSVVLGNQNPSMFGVSFYLSQADADAGTNEIANPQTFTNTANPQTIYIILTAANSGCFAATSFDLITIDCTTNVDNDLVATADEDVNNNGNLNDDDTDGDGLRNFEDNDDDDDGVLTADEDYNSNGDPTDDDTDNSGTPDYLESNVTLAVSTLDNVELDVYPNPANGKIYVSSNNYYSINKIEVYNIIGQKVQSFSFSKAQNIYTLDISNLVKGTYFLQIQGESQTTLQKIIIY